MKGQPRNTGKTISEADFRRLWTDLSISATEIGRRLGISQQAVTYRAQSRGLPARPKRGAKPVCDADHLGMLYAAGLSMLDMAEVMGCDRKTVHNYCVRLGLPRRGSGHRPKITLADYRALQLRAALAASASETAAAMRDAEMVDNFQVARWAGRKAA